MKFSFGFQRAATVKMSKKFLFFVGGFLPLIPHPIYMSCSLLWTRISGPAYITITHFDSKYKHDIGNLMARVTFSASIIVLVDLARC